MRRNMDILEDFNAQMEGFLEQKKSEDRIPQSISDVWDCATNVDEYGLVDYDSTNLHNELEKLQEKLAIIKNSKKGG